MINNKGYIRAPSPMPLGNIFSNFAIDSDRSDRQLSVTLNIAIWHRRGFFFELVKWVALKNTLSMWTDIWWYLPVKTYTRQKNEGKILSAGKRRQLAQVRRLDSAYNLVFLHRYCSNLDIIVVFTLQATTSRLFRMTENHPPRGSSSFKKHPFFQRVAHEFISDGALFSFSLFLLRLKLRRECEKYEMIWTFDSRTDVEMRVFLSRAFFEIIFADSRPERFLFQPTNRFQICNMV